MKKLITLILAICMCLSVGLALTACDSDSEPNHTHKFKTSWSYNETYHWYACEGKGCTEVSEKTEHSFVEDICSVCSYDRSTPPLQPSVNEVTEAQFNSAMLALSNVTFDFEFNEPDGTVVTCKWYIDGNKLKMESDSGNEDIIAIFEILGNSIVTYIYMDISEYTGWIKFGSDSIYLTYIESALAISNMLEELSFSNCEYSEGYYYCTNTFFEQTEAEETLTFKLQFEDGVLLSLRIDDGEFYESYVFSNYGSTTVTVPTEYMDVSEVNPQPSGEWANLFEFENVTVLQSTTTTYSEPYETVLSSSSSIKIDGNKWIYFEEDGYYAGSFRDLLVYFDGQDVYLDGEVVEGTDNTLYYSGDQYLFIVEMFSSFESIFTETSSGVFEASELVTASVSGKYENIKIVVVDNKIQSVEFTMVIDTTDIVCDSYYCFEFSNYGTTVVEYTGQPSQSKSWADYFVFDNVTADKTIVLTNQQEGYGSRVSEFIDQIKINENGWWLKTYADYGEGYGEPYTNIALNDGNQTNIIQNDRGYAEQDFEDLKNEYFSQLNNFAYYGSYFTETSSGVFELDELCYLNSSPYVGTYTDVKIIIVDGYISSIEYTDTITYGEYSEIGVFTIEFSNWGSTVISSESQTQPEKSWADYFVFDNVTATCTEYVDIVEDTDDTDYPFVSTMCVQGDKWYMERYILDTLDKAYWDGSQIHCEKQTSFADSDLYMKGSVWFATITMMKQLEDDLIETADGVYELQEKTLYETIYKDVKIVIVDGYIQSFECTSVTEILGETMITTCSMTFTNWGTTVVNGLK